MAYGIGHRQVVTDLVGQRVRPFQQRQGRLGVFAYDLVERAKPEQSLSLAPNVAESAIQLGRALEVRQLARVLLAALEKLGVPEATAGKTQVRFHAVEHPVP